MKRDVTLIEKGDTIAVEYVSRAYRGRYWAASFYAPDHTLDNVRNWVRNNPALNLVESPTTKTKG